MVTPSGSNTDCAHPVDPAPDAGTQPDEGDGPGEVPKHDAVGDADTDDDGGDDDGEDDGAGCDTHPVTAHVCPVAYGVGSPPSPAVGVTIAYAHSQPFAAYGPPVVGTGEGVGVVTGH